LEVARDTGLLVEAYVYLWWGGDTAVRVAQAIDLVAPYNVRRLWIDCEDNGDGAPSVPPAGSGYTPAALRAAIAGGLEMCDAAHVPCGLYSGAWWWRPAMSDDQSFADRAWWVACCDGVAEVAMWGPPFAGITQPIMKQYAGTTSAYSLSVDLNVALG
jgi:hypothetical protein